MGNGNVVGAVLLHQVGALLTPHGERERDAVLLAASQPKAS